MRQRIIISDNLSADLYSAIAACEPDKVFVIVDECTLDKCLPLISDLPYVKDAPVIAIKPTDAHKDLEAVSHVWKSLCDNGATRHSCVINLGGGMVTDLGGFAASTFKRGVSFINVPTTLLSMVDASVGGKTGVNFNGLKNEIGVFNDSRFVIIHTDFLKTLDTGNIVSGYAEMLKHGLISDDKTWRELISFDIQTPDLSRLQSMVADSVGIKERIVENDPLERGLRKALNLGHTIGHALESLALRDNCHILHGHAVALGLVCELYLSCVKVGFPTEKMRLTVNYIKENYGRFLFECDDYEYLLDLMRHDKKNKAGVINFTMLGDIGDIRINQTASREDIYEALDFLREG